jgi:hypothetical protein
VVDLCVFNLAVAEMTFKSVLLAGLVLTLGACAHPPEYASFLTPTETGAPALLNELARVNSLSPERRRRELAELDAMRRLDEARRFQLAALLEREDNVDALERSLKNLNSLSDGDSRTQALIDLMKKSLKARIELKEQTTRAQDLQDRLEQFKALEKSLQQRNPAAPTKTP